MQQCKIAVVGMGYVGMSLAVLLGQKHFVYALDVQEDKVDLIFSHINSVPREALGNKTPYEIFTFIYGEKPPANGWGRKSHSGQRKL